MKNTTTTQDKTTGILLVCTGHVYYARLAYNLLVSIRYHDKNIPVAILVNGDGFSYLDPECQKQFTHVIPVPVDSDPYKIKLCLDQFTPFDNTLYLDVDMVWCPFKTPQQLIDECSGTEFQCISRSRESTEELDLKFWMDLKEVKQVYGFEQVYNISSEIMYFEGKPSVFEMARKIYDQPKVSINKFGAGYPDEAYLIIALELEKMTLKMNPWEPTYWQPRYYMRIHNRQYIQQYYALSVGGSHTIGHIKEIYDSLLDMYFYQTGMPGNPFRFIQKSLIFNERRKI